MKSTRIVRAVCVAGLSAACVWSLAGCANTASSTASASGANTGLVAATVNGVEISEDEVTNYIESYRTSAGLTDEDSWGEWLASNSMTPESVREEIINSYVQRELIKEAADEKAITVESSEIDTYVDKTKANYDTDEKWQAALEQAGMTEQEYRDELDLQLKAQKLQESFASDEEPSEEDMLMYAQMYASAYDGAKRSSHILFSADDEATAQQVLDQINSGELDFVEAVKQYSQDEGTAVNDGDVGWDKSSNLVTEYTDALAGLEKDQVSGLVTSTYGIHIIKCTDVFNAPKTTGEDGTETVTITSIDQIPSEWVDSIKSSLQSQSQSEAYSAWYEEYEAAADVVINDMPEGLPYAVDMSKYETATDESTTEDGSSSVTNEDGSTTTTYEDGTSRTDYPDGTYSTTDASGVVSTYDATGALVSEGSADAAATDETGESTEASTEQPAEAA